MRTRSEARIPTKSTKVKLISSKKNLQQLQNSSPSPRHLKQPQSAKSETTTSPVQHETGVRNVKLMSPRSRNIAQTPGRDDVLCSQHFDSQMVVGWDCNSPDTLRGIKRISGPDHDDVSDLVMRLIGQETDDEVFTKHSTPPLLGVWKEDSEDKLLDDKTVVAQRLRRNRGRQRRKSGKESAVSKELLSKLSLALDKCAEVDEGEEKRDGDDELFLLEEEESTKQHNCSDDLFNSESNDVEVKTTRSSSRHLEQKNTKVEIKNKSEEDRNSCARSNNSSSKSKDQALDSKTCENAESCDTIDNQTDKKTEDAEEDWSDDELFEEDSFIVKATQVSTEVKKFVSPVFGMKRKSSVEGGLPKSKCSRYSFQLGADDGKDNQKDSATEKFTYLQSKKTESGCSSHSRGNVNSVSKPCAHNSMVTKSDNRKPAVYQSVLSSRASCSNMKPNTGVQVFSSCANPMPINGANNNQNMPLTRQRTCTSSNYVNSNCRVPIVSKPTNTQTSSTFTNLTFKKHNSFSGTGSQNLVSSRRRSVSGDKQAELGTGVKNFYGGTTGCNPVKNVTVRTNPSVSTACMTRNIVKNSVANTVSPVCNTSVTSHPMKNSTARTYLTVCSNTSVTSHPMKNSTARTYPTVSSNTSVISHPTKNSTARTYPTVCSNTSVISHPIKNSTAKTYPTVCSNTSVISHPTKNSTARTYPTVCHTRMTCQPIKNSTTRTYQSVCNTTVNSNKSSVPFSDSRSHAAETPKLERKQPSVGGFDTSLSDDLLCQLAEPDEILDSQCDVTLTVKPVTHVPSTSSYKFVDYKHPAKQYTFKQSQKKSISPEGNKQCNKLKETVTPAPGIHVNRKEPRTVLEEYSEDLFASDDDDDMLLADDDGLTEPQILAMLDEVEMLATQQHNSQRSNQNLSNFIGGKGQNVSKTPISNHVQDFKTSQRQSVKKYETSDHGTDLDHRVDLAGSQGQLVGSQGQLAGSQGQLAGSQGQHAGSQGHSSSQSKYSPAEIERKKQEAMERRKLKLKKV
ncbi:uncharacterized protein LOC123545160 isoform X2 [Mercenaria mercenaria]|uniref:uncharacterized protein LOC123545160 isoform X2 n=1 Tax=Mercenaria mercenaria TaxID=6596 RepID=UPI00234E61DB|nr:uncharacterized protein LOC123545160 isoform X2 [Mercenaria mercenaria]